MKKKKSVKIKKRNLDIINIDSDSIDQLNEGEVLLEIDKFAFTANNITYAVLGEKFNYWKFFPAGEEHGIIPVWGYADIVESTVDNLKVGERIYGYFPMASHLVISVDRLNPYGFIDASAHRKELPVVYNYYERVAEVPYQTPIIEAPYMLFQPLYVTSFLIADYYTSNEYFGAENMVLTSASSKTSIALAYLINQQENDIKTIGLTSPDNVAFVLSLGCYDEVYSYDEIADINLGPTCIVDFSGNKEIMISLQEKLLPQLKFSSAVGMSHWDKGGISEKYPFKTEVFFAPFHAKQKQTEWGPKEFKMKLDSALYPFLAWSLEWMNINSISGSENILEKYHEVLQGKMNPQDGIVMSFM